MIMYSITYITLTLMLVVIIGLIICLPISTNVYVAESEANVAIATLDSITDQRDIGESKYSPAFVEEGIATWISNSYHRQVTAGGEKYDKNSLVAAHHWLPFGTLVKVTNFENNKFVIVKISDRKSYSATNIIVVSWRAAQKLEMIDKGKVKVKVEAISEQHGVASWYGHPFHGRTTANGETYDMGKLTAAHKKLPFNTKVRVTNLSNGKSVIVRINDRGPYIKGRIIDLSKEAARQINMVEAGISMVELSILGQ
jgi:rare lipoprotein A